MKAKGFFIFISFARVKREIRSKNYAFLLLQRLVHALHVNRSAPGRCIDQAILNHTGYMTNKTTQYGAHALLFIQVVT
jgi:hypothetical protein